MLNITEEFDVTVDGKGRFLLPAGFRKQLPADCTPNKFVVNRGIDKCIVLYTMEDWAVEVEKINRLNEYDPQERLFKRMFMSGVATIELDSAGRLMLPKQLILYAQIDKDMTISAQGNKIELWDTAKLRAMVDSNMDNFSDMAAMLANKLAGQTKNEQ